MAKTEDAIRSIASSFLGMISIFEVVDGSNLIGLWLPPHHFFLQNLIWREATIVWNGHQSKKLKNRFRLRLDHSVLNTVGANQMELIEWKVSLGIRSIIPSVQDITLGRSRIDKQMQISLFFVMTQKPTLAILLGHPLVLIILTGLGFFPFLTISDALASASLEAQISRNFGSWTSFELLKYHGCGVSVSV